MYMLSFSLFSGVICLAIKTNSLGGNNATEGKTETQGETEVRVEFKISQVFNLF